jgi:hypothetical protein
MDNVADNTSQSEQFEQDGQSNKDKIMEQIVPIIIVFGMFLGIFFSVPAFFGNVTPIFTYGVIVLGVLFCCSIYLLQRENITPEYKRSAVIVTIATGIFYLYVIMAFVYYVVSIKCHN